ncbi:MAG TPA: nucleoside-diphosphate sugar epimerase/dehydratase [Bryobacteraceae bacterium]|jgi:FlaA1/EpsC-like NDP-sugar epimerase|nr:nucleoside-diphosphate sugar epimerase/dehydratase [Bryobacteraceae bacterium]
MSRLSIYRTRRYLTYHPRWLIDVVQVGLFVLSCVVAFLLRFDLTIPGIYRHDLLLAVAVLVPAKIVTFTCYKLNRGWWRYISVRDVTRIGLANLFGSALGCAVLLPLAPPGFPRSIYFLDFLLCFLLSAGVRMAVRLAFEFSRIPNLGVTRRALIYGAGDAGVALLREVLQNPALAYEVVGFIDDEPEKKGRFIHRVKVLGDGAALRLIVPSQAIDTVLIAAPSATGMQMNAILQHCQEARITFKTVPAIATLIAGDGLATHIRDVAVEDLLGRNPIHLDEDRLRDTLRGRTVMVTGAAGSIGSELCRQIARFQPSSIIGLDSAESPLFELDRELRQYFPAVPFLAEIGDIRNRARLNEVLGQYRPSTIYHAAAYKHVPLMETHIFEAVENNVFGTYNLAAAASAHGVEDFVMISSDKAVRPTNVMGATKRIAELVLLALQNGRTRFVAVRFGNVLGSNGSVIPIFKKQIAAGGPVTVTHPEMRRYFMTIPEACQLVLQAGAIGEGGQICVLDMGEPVKIVDLARNLILLSGLRPDQDIKIDFTGMRPGEKLYEELSTLLENTAPTMHEKIRVFVGNGAPETGLDLWLDNLRQCCATRDVGRLVVAFKDLVLDYNPSCHLLKRLLADQPRRIADPFATAFEEHKHDQAFRM